MEALIFESEATMLIVAVAGLFATLIAIVRDTRIRRHSAGPAIP